MTGYDLVIKGGSVATTESVAVMDVAVQGGAIASSWRESAGREAGRSTRQAGWCFPAAWILTVTYSNCPAAG